MEYILAIDQGTTNTKAMLVDEAGVISHRASRSIPITYPHPAWVEQNPMDLWESVVQAASACLDEAGNPPLAAIAITNQRETTLMWDRITGQPVGPAVVWQCRRSAEICDQLTQAGYAETIHARTGLQLDPGFSAGKARWLLEHAEDGVIRGQLGELCIGTMDSWLLWNLSQDHVHATDMTNASRTQLFNLAKLAWDEDLLELFGVPKPALPEVYPSSHLFGITQATGAIPAGVPIASLVGDSHSALFGHGEFQPGTVKATYGTGSSLMSILPTTKPILSQQGLSSTIAWSLDTDSAVYAFEGNIPITGAAVQWLGDFLKIEYMSDKIEALAESVVSSEGVVFVPAFVGLGAPYWDSDARGLITGITRGTTQAHLARATLEAITWQVRDVFDLMQAELGKPLTTLLADGGASRNNLLMHLQADAVNRPVQRNLSSDLSALGAAYLAGLAVGVWSSTEEISTLPRTHDTFQPAPTQETDATYKQWQEAIHKARSHS